MFFFFKYLFSYVYFFVFAGFYFSYYPFYETPLTEIDYCHFVWEDPIRQRNKEYSKYGKGETLQQLHPLHFSTVLLFIINFYLPS